MINCIPVVDSEGEGAMDSPFQVEPCMQKMGLSTRGPTVSPSRALAKMLLFRGANYNCSE